MPAVPGGLIGSARRLFTGRSDEMR